MRSFHKLAIGLVLLSGTHAVAAEVPVHVQLPLFANIWKLDRSFQPAGDTAVVAVIHQETNIASAAALREVAAWAGRTTAFRVVSVTLDAPNWEQALQTTAADVFYVTPMRGVDIRRIATIARRRGIRTMAGLTEYLQSGLSVAIGVRNDRPLILINLEAARAEGASYESQLLRLAEIVRK